MKWWWRIRGRSLVVQVSDRRRRRVLLKVVIIIIVKLGRLRRVGVRASGWRIRSRWGWRIRRGYIGGVIRVLQNRVWSGRGVEELGHVEWASSHYLVRVSRGSHRQLRYYSNSM